MQIDDDTGNENESRSDISAADGQVRKQSLRLKVH